MTDRTLFVRQAANLGQVKAMIQHRLTIISGPAQQPIQIIDTLPVPVCVYTRSARERYRCLTPDADDGYGAAKDLRYSGFKLGLRVSPCGMIVAFPVLPARPHDLQLLDDLIDGFVGWIPADKGFIDAFRQALLAERHAIQLVTPPRKNMDASPYPPVLLNACQRWRKCVETVGSHLTEQFAIARIRVRDGWHFQHRVIRKVLAQTVGVFLNLRLGRPPLDLDGLITC